MEYEALAQEVQHNLFLLFRRGPRQDADKLSHGELCVLYFLAKRGGQSLPGELSTASGVSSARTAAVLNGLEKKGEIIRLPDENDRRRVQVKLTECGRRRLEEEKAGVTRRLEEVLHELGEEDAETFLRLLRRLVEITGAGDKTDCRGKTRERRP